MDNSFEDFCCKEGQKIRVVAGRGSEVKKDFFFLTWKIL